MFGKDRLPPPVYTAPSPADMHGTTAFGRPDMTERRGMIANLTLKQKALGVLAAGGIVAGAVFGGDVYDAIHDQLHASEYYAPEWADEAGDAPAIWGKAVAMAAQDSRVASETADDIEVNIFQDGVEGSNGSLIAPFENMTGISYAVMFAITRGNPEYVLGGTTGSILPVKNSDAEQAAKRMRLDSYAKDDVSTQALIFARVLNDKAAALWSLNSGNGVYRDANTPQEEQTAWMKDTLAAYVESLGLKNNGAALTADQIAKVAGVIYKLADDWKSSKSATFSALVAAPDVKAGFDAAGQMTLQWAAFNRIKSPVLTDDQEDKVDAIKKTLHPAG